MISVIVPIYQVEDYIEECLISLTNQTYQDIEIICINDCTLDNSITIVKEFCKKDSRIRLVNHEENRGLGGARNTGIRSASGEYIMFIDSDDYTDKTMIEKLYQSLTSAGSDAAVCGVMLTYSVNQTFSPHTAFHYDKLASEQIYNLDDSKDILTDMWPSAWNKLFKSSIIKTHNILFKERILYEDHTFFYEYFSYCHSFSYVNEPLYYYRQQRPYSITTQSTGREKEIFTILNYIDEIFKGIYSQEQYKYHIAKITVRLLYERRWVFSDSDPNYYDYLRKVSAYFDTLDKQFLIQARDSFIEETDPVFYSLNEINNAERNRKTSPSNSYRSIAKRVLKKIPPIKQAVILKGKFITIRNDFYWYIEHIYEKMNSHDEYIRHKLNELTWVSWNSNEKLVAFDDLSQKIEQISEGLEHLIDSQKYFATQEIIDNLDKKISVINKNVQSSTAELYSQLSRMLELHENLHFEERFSNLESTLTTYKKKTEEIWWLSWNIKDQLQASEKPQENNSSFLRYYPTWIPCEFPEYFKGNTWYWADNFKAFFIEHKDTCDKDLNNLFKDLSSKDVEFLKILWERNTKILPYSRYCDLQGYLLKRDFIFTKEELKEQDTIFRSYTDIISRYILPDKATYEIPVFYYAHGLKTMPQNALQYIRNGDILDLGGFIGDSALILSEYTNEHIYTVEMNHDNIQTMQTVLNMNHCSDKVISIESAVSDIDEMQNYYGNSSYSTLNDMSNNIIYEEHKMISVHKVDTLVSKYNITPHLMKLDVEGAEFKAILGAKETIHKFRPVLSISIYHTANDFLYIKPLIESWDLKYHFHIENHNPFDPVYEKVLICIPQEYI